jgi:hypothetical protein
MIKKRQAVTPILATVILISIGLVIVAGVTSFYLGISYDSLNCEIKSAQLFQISDSVLWGSIQAYNDGEYSIEDYSILIHDNDAQNILVITRTGMDISPKESIIEEFEISQQLSSENILLEILIKNQDSQSQCMVDVEI